MTRVDDSEDEVRPHFRVGHADGGNDPAVQGRSPDNRLVIVPERDRLAVECTDCHPADVTAEWIVGSFVEVRR